MTLTLKIIGRDRLENGSPIELVLHQRGAVIGRSATCEWPLPDDGRLLSRNHCKILFDDGAYMLEDTSTNGTFLKNSDKPISGSHRLAPNDIFKLGNFEVQAKLSGEALSLHQSKADQQNSAGQRQDWDVWDDTPIDALQNTPAPHRSEDDAWGIGGEEAEDVSAWSDKKNAAPVGPTPDQIFETLTDNHEVDWDDTAWDVDVDFDPFSGDEPAAPQAKKDPFGSLDPNAAEDFSTEFGDVSVPQAQEETVAPAPAETDSPEFWDKWQSNENPTQLGEQNAPGSVPSSLPSQDRAPGTPQMAAAQPMASPLTPPASVPGQSHDVYKSLIASLGVSSSKLTGNPEETAARAGRMLRRLLAGLVTLLEARARAKDAMGASATQLSLDGNNPLKFARDIDQALNMMMNPARPGYMEVDLAIEDSYRDLQAHQIATLKAMQGALKTTINRFSPDTIKKEATENGFLTKILPGQRDAALWRAYEKQFNGSVQGSAEAFFDTFSTEFRKAYEDATRKN